MRSTTDHPIPKQTATHPECARLHVSLELSRKVWLLTSLAPHSEKMSKHSVPAGDAPALLQLLARLKANSEQRIGAPVEVVVIQEAGLDGFWLHRLLEANEMGSHVVDPASIAVPRRHRRAKTDVIDGETLLRTLGAWKRGEPRVCAMVAPPSPDEEDRRRFSRGRETLLRERIQHTNRIRGLLFGQGITDYNPLRKDRRTRLEKLETGDGRPLPAQLKAEIVREIERLELLLGQTDELEAERDAHTQPTAAAAEMGSTLAMLMLRRHFRPKAAFSLWRWTSMKVTMPPRRIAAGHDGKYREEQHMGQLVELSLCPAWIGNLRQQAQKRRECSHGNLRFGCRPKSQTSADSRIPFLIRRVTSLRLCCTADSVQPIRQR